VSDQGERPSYDAAEVRRSIAVCFSTKDLRELVEGLGASDLSCWDRGIQEAAREVVRQFDRVGSLDRLVEALKQARPLMEWPAPVGVAHAPAPLPFFPPAPPLTPPPAPAPALAPEPAPTLAPEPAPTLAPEPAAAPEPATPEPAAPAPTAVDAPRSPAPDAPVLRDPYAAGWPGTAAPPRAPTNSADGRKFTLLFAIAGVLVAVAAIVAFLVGRSGAGSSEPDPLLVGKDAMAKGERPLRESGPARLAADAVERSLGKLARGCDLPLAPGEYPGAELFKVAYEQCGFRPTIGHPPILLHARPDDAPSAGDTPLPDEPANKPKAEPRARTNTTPRPVATPDKLPSNASACIDRCSASQRQCNQRCGKEPTSSSQYGQWQSCQSGCLSAASQCRLACQ